VMGVTLRKTTYDEALHILRNMPSPPGYTMTFEFDKRKSTDSMKVITIQLLKNGSDPVFPQQFEMTIGFWENVATFAGGQGEFFTSTPTLADFTLLYGPPQCANHDYGMGNHWEDVYFIDERNDILIFLFGWYPLEWESSVITFSVSTYDRENPNNRDPCGCLYWRGIYDIWGTGGGLCGEY
jgi:hypothetical protein